VADLGFVLLVVAIFAGLIALAKAVERL